MDDLDRAMAEIAAGLMRWEPEVPSVMPGLKAALHDRAVASLRAVLPVGHPLR